MLPGREAQAPPSSPAPWHLRQQGGELRGLTSTTRPQPHGPPMDFSLGSARSAMYGYRRVGAALRHQGVVVNGKRLRRLMREHDLQPKQRRRDVVTTDSDHAGPIYSDLAKGGVPDRPNQIWVADLTCVAIPGGFVYLAAILDESRGRRDQPLHGCPDCRRSLEGSDQEQGATKRLHSPFRSWVAIRIGGVSHAAGGPWPDGLDEPPG